MMSCTAASRTQPQHHAPGVKLPATRPDFWKAKLLANVKRDRFVIEALNAMGWRVLCVWECATRQANADHGLQNALQLWIEGDSPFGEISGASRG